DPGATGQSVVQCLDDQYRTAAGNHETVTSLIEGTGSFFRSLVVFGRQGAHGIEHVGQGPVLGFAAACKHNILLVQLDELHGVANAVRAGGTGGRNGVVDTLDLEWSRQA